MFRVALSGNEELFGPYHSSTMRAVRSLEAMYRSEGRLEMADRMSQRASEASDILIRRSEPSLSRSGLDGVRTKRLLEPIIKI
ncbi:hypothetical protein BJY04DRAFT_200697, partial [Aspergillus karnatakaensis]|uniref:uncharacterized protein n=1 Tax=Aspergillus karnatakaensis TaxID=1810916 RepID=UPI003CCD8887